MAKNEGRTLTDNRVKALEPGTAPYRVADTTGIGLMIEVHPSGSKLWRLRFRQHGRARMVSLGKFGSAVGFVNTQSAKAKAAALRASIKEGVDPVLQKHRAERVHRTLHEARAAGPT